MPRLIWVFVGRTATLLVLTCRGSNQFSRFFSIAYVYTFHYKTTPCIGYENVLNQIMFRELMTWKWQFHDICRNNTTCTCIEDILEQGETLHVCVWFLSPTQSSPCGTLARKWQFRLRVWTPPSQFWVHIDHDDHASNTPSTTYM